MRAWSPLLLFSPVVHFVEKGRYGEDAGGFCGPRWSLARPSGAMLRRVRREVRPIWAGTDNSRKLRAMRVAFARSGELLATRIGLSETSDPALSKVGVGPASLLF